MSTPTRHRLHPGVIALVVVITFSVVAWLVDSLFAARAEADLSARVEEQAELETSPDAYIGGFPFLQVLVTEEIPHISVSALDVDIAGLGIVNTRTKAYNLEISRDDALRGDVLGSRVSSVKRSVSLDGVALGQVLDMTDLDLRNPYDISPAGGTASEAEMTGTPPGFAEPVTVLTSLRLQSGVYHQTVLEIIDAPEGRRDDIVEAFTLVRDTRTLPIGGPATAVFLGSGSIHFESSRYNTDIRSIDLAPRATGESEFTS